MRSETAGAERPLAGDVAEGPSGVFEQQPEDIVVRVVESRAYRTNFERRLCVVSALSVTPSRFQPRVTCFIRLV